MSRIRANTVSLGISFMGTAVLALLQYKIITTSMPQGQVGMWSTLFAMGALLGTLTELGLPMVMVRFGARYDARNNLPRLGQLIGFALRFHLIAVAAMVVVLVFTGPWVARLFGGGELTRWQVLLAYLALSSGTLRAMNNAAFRGLRRMNWMAGLEILFASLVTVGYFLFRDSLTVERLLIIFWVGSLTSAVLGLLALRRMLVRLGQGAPAFDGESILDEVRGYWTGAAFAGVFLIAIESVDKLLVATILSFEAVAVFQVATRLALFPRRLLYVPLQVMSPEVTHKWESGRGEELRVDLQLFIKLLMGLGLLLVGPIAVFAKPIILLISTREYLAGADVLWVFAGVIPLLTLHQPLSMVFRAVGHVWFAFFADAGWLLVYLGVGSLLAGPLGLVGFVAGQVVASACVLSYTLVAFSRLGLPGPSAGFFVRRVILATVVWLPCVALGRWLSPDAPVVLLAGIALGLLVLANLLIVLGGYLSHNEEQRTIAMLAGRGAVGRLARFAFAWPRRLAGRGAAAVLAVVLAGSLAGGLTGCSQEAPAGCSSGDAVPSSYREAVEEAAGVFWERVRSGDAQAVWDHTASPVQANTNIADFIESIRMQIGPFAFPETLETVGLHLVYLKPGSPAEFPVPCERADGASPDMLNLLKHPLQASIVQEATVNQRRLRYSQIFWFEDQEWKLGEFRVRMADLHGKDWSYWENLADAQVAKGNKRNGALLYNLSLELLVPNPWTLPGPVARIEGKQGELTVSNLPADRLDIWTVDDLEYRVFKVEYDLTRREGLGLVINYETFEDVTDTLIARYLNDELAGYVSRRFPEYPEVFNQMVIRVVPAEEHGMLGYISVHPFLRQD